MRWFECPQPGCGQQLCDNIEGPQTHEIVCGFCKAICSINAQGEAKVLHAAAPGRLRWLDGLRQRGQLVVPLPLQPDRFHEQRLALARERGDPIPDEYGKMPRSPLQPPSTQELIEQRRGISTASRMGPGSDAQQQPPTPPEEPKPKKASLWRTGTPEPEEQPPSPLLVRSPGTEPAKSMRIYDAARIVGLPVDTVISIGQAAGILPAGSARKLRFGMVTPEGLVQLRAAAKSRSVSETLGRPDNFRVSSAEEFFEASDQQGNEKKLERKEE